MKNLVTVATVLVGTLVSGSHADAAYFYRYQPNTKALPSITQPGAEPSPTQPEPTLSTSCKAILDAGDSTGNGVYEIDPDGDGSGFSVYCDMTTDGGGWTVVARGLIGEVNPNWKTDSGTVSGAYTLATGRFAAVQMSEIRMQGASNRTDAFAKGSFPSRSAADISGDVFISISSWNATSTWSGRQIENWGYSASTYGGTLGFWLGTSLFSAVAAGTGTYYGSGISGAMEIAFR